MKDSIINYEIAFANFTQKIKKMTVGNIKKTGIKKIAKLLIILSIIYNQATSGNLVYSHLILKERHRHLLPTGFAEILNMHI